MAKKQPARKPAKKIAKKPASTSTAVAVYNPQNIVKETGAQVSHMLGTLMQFSRDKDIDVVKAREIATLITDLMGLQAKQAYNGDMGACQRAIPYMAPDRQAADGAKQKWVTLEKMHKIAKPIIAKYGFALTYGTDVSPQPGWIRVKCDVLHTGGHVQTYFADAPPDIVGIKGTTNKTGVQGYGSTASYLQRYLMKLIFNITTAGEDDDGRGGEQPSNITAEQVKRIQTLMTATNTPATRVLDYASRLAKTEIMSIQDIPPNCFATIENQLSARQQASKK